MRIGLPTSDGTIAPVLDWADTLLIAECRERTVVDSRKVKLTTPFVPLRAKELHEQKISYLVCDGISTALLVMLRHLGIPVIQGIRGDYQEALRQFLENNLEPFMAQGGKS